MWYQLNYFCWTIFVKTACWNFIIPITKTLSSVWTYGRDWIYVIFRRSLCLTISWMFGTVCEKPHLRSLATLIFLRLQVSKCNSPQSQRYAFYFIYKTPSLKTGKYEVKCKRNECFMSSQYVDFILSKSDCSLLKTAPKTHCQRVDFG